MSEHAGEYAWLTRDVVSRQTALRPDGLVVQDLPRQRRVTYGQLEDELRRCEAWLRGVVSPGARVAFLARNSLHHFVLFYACPRAGACFQPLNWRLSGPELAVLLEDAAPEVLIYEAEFEAEALMALAQSPVPHVLKIAGPHGDAFAQALARETPVTAAGLIDPLAPGMLLYTSGTTGRPKGVIVTPKNAYFSAMNYTYVAELTAEHALLCDVPMFHVVGLLAIMHGTLLAGGSVHLSDRFVPSATLQRLSDPTLAVSHYFCVPQMAQTLVDDPGFAEADLKGLRIFTGGAPMPQNLTLALLDAGMRPSNGYGMSENGTILGMPLDPKIARAKLGSCGVPAPAVEIRIVGPDGRDTPAGEVGEIWLRGPSVTSGYWNQPEATAKTFSGDWFRTGDAARCDEDGYHFIVDRWKDMYITGGENVYPGEVEAALTLMDAVAEAAVIGVADARWGESGCAYLVLKSGAQADVEAVMAWCDTRLARYKRPAHVRFTEALPRTASGKIQKDILRRGFAAEAESELPS